MPLGSGLNVSFIKQDKDAQKLICKGREMVWYSRDSACAKSSLIPGKAAVKLSYLSPPPCFPKEHYSTRPHMGPSKTNMLPHTWD